MLGYFHIQISARLLLYSTRTHSLLIGARLIRVDARCIGGGIYRLKVIPPASDVLNEFI
jgi:hypothetical protein